jgi:hypothetical protein
MSSDADTEDSEDTPGEVVLKHEYSDDYQLVPATGVHGGYQPQNNFKIDFVLDHNERMQSQTIKYDEDGVTAGVEETFDDHLIREHRTGVTMDAKDAFQAACWMLAEIIPDATSEDIQNVIANEYNLGDETDD